MNTYFDSWLAWPIIKGELWSFLLTYKTRNEYKKRSNLLNKFIGCFKGCVNLLFIFFCSKSKYIFVYSPKDGNGREKIDRIFEVLLNEYENEALKILYEWGDVKNKKLKKNTLYESYVGNVFFLFSILISKNKPIRDTTFKLCQEIKNYFPEDLMGPIFKKCSINLSIFFLKYNFYKYLFRRTQAIKLFIQDPDAKPGEVAAAKLLKIPVVEIQHGMFGPDDVDYSWKSTARKLKSYMPVSDQILVYGSAWKDILLSNGFWHESEIKVIAHSEINFYRRLKNRPSRLYQPIILLFPTQNHVRSKGIYFLKALLDYQAKKKENLFKVIIKIHPTEWRMSSCYEKLSVDFPRSCYVLPLKANSYLSLLDAHIVIGFSSLMMIEAVALQIPAISIGEKEDGGFCEIYHLEQLKKWIPHFCDPIALYDYLKYLAQEQRYLALQENLREISESFYSV
ncbi:MAG TPA: hypothetical protein VJB02_01755 [Coxiellaceae bacterium]|nr:hypothetical protein [Coxiellaceae bacterium]